MAPTYEKAELALEDMVVARLLDLRARESPDRDLITFGDDTWSTARVADESALIAAGLAGSGIGRGDAVAILLPNGPEFISSYFALSRLAAVAVTINTAYRGYLLEHVLNDTAAGTLIVHAPLLDRVEASAGAVPGLRRVVVLGADAGRLAAAGERMPGVEVLDYARLREGAPGVADASTFEDVNCVIYTSGTTGPSKGVPITNAHAVSKALEVIRICEIRAGDVIYSPLPLFHSMALLRGVLAGLVAGGSCVLRERFSASGFCDDVRRVGATVGHCVFSIPEILKKLPPSPDDRDHSLRSLYNARQDTEFEERFGVRLIEGYGLTEAGVAMYMRPDDPPRPGSCGRVSDEWEVQLFDAADRPVTTGEIGEIVLRPRRPHLVTPGYLNRPEATAEQCRNLWFHTGDLATVDDEGYFYFKDRKKDAIRRRGENISSWELEQVLRGHASVAEAVALPYPSPVGEDDVRVIVTLREGARLTPEELLAHCAERLPDFMVPRYVEIREDLPRTPTGRIEKYRLRDEPLASDCHDRGDDRPARR